LDHYLEVLLKKPGALPGATALVQARRSGVFTAEHEAFWAAARTALGDTAGTRELVEVLLLHRRHAHGEVIAGIAAALVVGAVRADLVAVEVRRLAQARPRTIAEPPSPSDTARVVSLTQRRLSDPDATFAALPPDRRPPPSVAAYDELLPRRAAATSTQPGAAASPASSEVS
jgi:hypothetical protein